MNGDGERSERGGQLREEAAAWFARMRGPDADRQRDAFEQWLARGALHRAAYNRVAGIFADGKHLKDYYRALRRRRFAMLPAGALLFVAIAPSMFILTGRKPNAEPASPVVRRQIVSVVGQVRTVRLPDGSNVVLDSDSLLAVRFNAGSRVIDLRRGRARFDVAHEARPFSVAARDVRVVAKGTLFDVCLKPGNIVDVDLLRGVVEVIRRPPDHATGIGEQKITLRAGQSARQNPAGHLAVTAASPTAADWPSMHAEFDRVRLAEIVARANRYNIDKIVVHEADVADLRVSGTFRIDDSLRLSERLAALFDLDIDRGTPGVIILRRRAQK